MTSDPSKKSVGGRFYPVLCNILGTLILLAVIAVSIPLTVPRFMGYEIYSIVSGSMEPAIPVGSVVYVEPAAPQLVESGDVIAFRSGEDVVVHRVVENRFVVGEFVTKGDANAGEDLTTTPYDALIGRVAQHIPAVGGLMSVYASSVGRIYLIILAACGVMFNILAAQLRARRRDRIRRGLESDMLTPKTGPETVQEEKKKTRVLIRVIRVAMLLLAVVFLFSAAGVFAVRREYRLNEVLMEEASSRFTASAPAAVMPRPTVRPESTENTSEEPQEVREPIYAPITVDFGALCSENPDVVGWLYCEGTRIDYPLLQTTNNDYYLHRSYERNYSVYGSLFIDAENRPGLTDANVIIYGHHMSDGAMFACLEQWADQSFYEEHPVMWLLTPSGDYRIDLVAGYTTPAGSDTYTIFPEAGRELDGYIADALQKSDFTADVTTPSDGRYVLLSTCAYVFNNAGYVLHGLVVPADSVGGIPQE